MADSESLVDDFFPRLQITADKLMTREGIVSPLPPPSARCTRGISRVSARANVAETTRALAWRRVRKSRTSQFRAGFVLRR